MASLSLFSFERDRKDTEIVIIFAGLAFMLGVSVCKSSGLKAPIGNPHRHSWPPGNLVKDATLLLGAMKATRNSANK